MCKKKFSEPQEESLCGRCTAWSAAWPVVESVVESEQNSSSSHHTWTLVTWFHSQPSWCLAEALDPELLRSFPICPEQSWFNFSKYFFQALLDLFCHSQQWFGCNHISEASSRPLWHTCLFEPWSTLVIFSGLSGLLTVVSWLLLSSLRTYWKLLLFLGLKNHHIRTKLMCWLRVRVSGALSDALLWSTGSPPGRVLSPLSFVSYTHGCWCHGDSGPGVDDVIQWCKSSFFDITVKKTKEMIINLGKNPVTISWAGSWAAVLWHLINSGLSHRAKLCARKHIRDIFIVSSKTLMLTKPFLLCAALGFWIWRQELVSGELSDFAGRLWDEFTQGLLSTLFMTTSGSFLRLQICAATVKDQQVQTLFCYCGNKFVK